MPTPTDCVAHLTNQDVCDYSFAMDDSDDCLVDNEEESYQSGRNELHITSFDDRKRKSQSSRCMNGPSCKPSDVNILSMDNLNKPLTVNVMAVVESPVPKASRRVGIKKQKGMPERPLSAYNVFFKAERRRLMDEQDVHHKGRSTKGKISFEELGKRIGKSWQLLTPEEKQRYLHTSTIDVTRYRKEMTAIEQQKREKKAGQKSIRLEFDESDNTTFENNKYGARMISTNDSASQQSDDILSETMPSVQKKAKKNVMFHKADHQRNMYPSLNDINAATENQNNESYGDTPLRVDSNVAYCPTDFRRRTGRMKDDSVPAYCDYSGSVRSNDPNSESRYGSTMRRKECDSAIRSLQTSETEPEMQVFYGPPSFESDVHQALPPCAIECDACALPMGSSGGITEVLMPDKRMYKLEYRCFCMSKSDADGYLRTLHLSRNEYQQSYKSCGSRQDNERLQQRYSSPLGHRNTTSNRNDYGHQERIHPNVPSMSNDYRHSASLSHQFSYSV